MIRRERTAELVEAQLDVFDQQVGHLVGDGRAWETGQCGECDRIEVDAVVSLGLSIYHFIRRTDEHWVIAAKARAGESLTPRLVAAWYGRWRDPAERLAAFVSRLGDSGYAVEGADELVEACNDARLTVAVDIEGYERSVAELEAGGGRRLSEVMGGLRSRNLH